MPVRRDRHRAGLLRGEFTRGLSKPWGLLRLCSQDGGLSVRGISALRRPLSRVLDVEKLPPPSNGQAVLSWTPRPRALGGGGGSLCDGRASAAA